MGKRKMDSELHRIKLETGTVYQTSKGGIYYFRYQVKGERKCVSLKTANQEEAIRKAKALLPTVQATNIEVIATHVKVARKLAAQTLIFYPRVLSGMEQNLLPRRLFFKLGLPFLCRTYILHPAEGL